LDSSPAACGGSGVALSLNITGGGFAIHDANSIVTVSGLRSIGPEGSLSAVPGRAIHVTDSGFPFPFFEKGL
jgi:hypothetical protein